MKWQLWNSTGKIISACVTSQCLSFLLIEMCQFVFITPTNWYKMYLQGSNQIITIIISSSSKTNWYSPPDPKHVNELCIKWIYNITQFDIFCQTEGRKMVKCINNVLSPISNGCYHLTEDRDWVAETLLGMDGKFWIVFKMTML